MSSLTMTGDIDNGGNYLLDDQTTTNMMSKGTVYRFDGVDDKITVTDSSEIQDIFTGGGFVHTEIYPLSDGGGNFGRIADKASSNTPADGWSFVFEGESAGLVGLSFFRDRVTSNAAYKVANILPIETWSTVTVAYADNDTPAAIYINGILQTLTTSDVGSGAFVTDAGQNLLFADSATGSRNLDGSTGCIMLGNFAPTAAEVKDLISGNIPFKWQYGSQTAQNTSSTENGPASGYDTFDGASATAFHVIGDGTGTQVAGTADEIALVVGKEYTVSFDIVFNAPGTDVGPRLKTLSSLETGGADEILAEGTITADGSYSYSWISTVTETGVVQFANTNGNATQYTISNLVIVRAGAVALYTQDSISETTWYDKANGNDGAVTGAEVLNEPDHLYVNELETAGDAGIGQAPPVGLSTDLRNLQMGALGILSSHATVGLAKSTYISHNAVFADDATDRWEYASAASEEAAQIEVGSNGRILIKTAAAGTAGNAISWNTVLTMDKNSNAQVGGYLGLVQTDTDSAIEGDIWYDASENKLKFYNGAAVETITSAT
jgi:hypothetical protein